MSKPGPRWTIRRPWEKPLTALFRGHAVRADLRSWVPLLMLVFVAAGGRLTCGSDAVIEQAARTVVKIYGAGGYRGLEAYQTGFLVSPDGHVMTAMSTVLDSEEIDCVLDDGRRFAASLVGIDPRREIALLKLDGEGLPFAALSGASLAESRAMAPRDDAETADQQGATSRSEARLSQAGTRVYALSNLFGVAVGDERVSVQQGVISAVVPLAARRGGYEAPYAGDVYLLDFTVNNPGSAGGLLVDVQGRPVGMLGKELRSSVAGIWLNYAIPLPEVAASFNMLLSGQPAEAAASADLVPFNSRLLGFLLVPDILEKTPPFIEAVIEATPAAAAGLQEDDLLVAVGSRSVMSCAAVADELARISEGDRVRVSVIRDGRIVEADLGPRPATDFPLLPEPSRGETL
jgi:S1-C subfamily serine protease